MKLIYVFFVFFVLLGCDQTLTARIENVEVEETQLIISVDLLDPQSEVNTFSIQLHDEHETVKHVAGTKEGLSFSGSYDVYFTLTDIESGMYLIVIIVNDEEVTSQSVAID